MDLAHICIWCWKNVKCLPQVATFDCIELAQDDIAVSPSCRSANPAAVKETSMTDLENKVETAPSTQTSPADTDKPEVDLPKTS